LLALAGACFFALNGSVAKQALLNGISPIDLATLRISGASIILLIIALIFVPRDLKLRPKEILPMLVYGITAVSFTQFFYFIAIELLPIGVALVIEFTAPVLVALWFRYVQKKPVRKRVWLALALVLIGLATVTQAWQGITLNALGLLAAVGAALSLAAYFIGGEYYVRQRSALATAALSMTAGALFFLVVNPWWAFDWQALRLPVQVPGSTDWLVPLGALIGWVIVMGTVVPFLLSFSSLMFLDAKSAIIIASLEPVLASIIAFVLLGEVLTTAQMIGGVIVLVGVVLAETARLNPADIQTGAPQPT
jgi:drug/metabolite transporter (DMT)-like permease